MIIPSDMDVNYMSYYVIPCNLPIDLQVFKPSSITVVEGSSSAVPDTLFHLCTASVISSDKIKIPEWKI